MSTGTDEDADLPERMQSRDERRRARADKAAKEKKCKEDSTADVVIVNVLGLRCTPTGVRVRSP